MDPRTLRPPEGGTALVVIDIQERLFPALCATIEDVHQGTLEGERRMAFLKAATNLVAFAGLRGWPIIPTLQYPKGLGEFVEQIARELDRTRAFPTIEKVEFSAYRAPLFPERLAESGARAVVLAGCEAHVCVLETALDLIEHGFRVFVPWDAVASRREEDRRTALELLRSAGAVVTSSETLIFQALGRAGTADFKAIAPRLK